MPAKTAARVVNFGIDTYIVNVKLANSLGQPSGQELPEPIQEQLSMWQQQARLKQEPIATSLVYHGQTLFMRGHGADPWQWLLFNELVTLDMARGRMNGGLICQARLSAFLLWSVGAETAILELEQLLSDFVGSALHLQPSEVHVCADVVGWDVARLNWLEGFVSRVVRIRERPELPDEAELQGGLSRKQRKDKEHQIGAQAVVTSEYRRVATLDFGSHGSDIQCCIYNKTREIKKSKKAWFVPLWERQGYDGQATVWRIEFRFRRKFLASAGLNCAYTLLTQLAHLWAYATEKWLRYVDLSRSTDSNKSRWPAAPEWLVVQQAVQLVQAPVSEPLLREEKRISKLKACVAAVAGYATSAAALAGDAIAEQPDLFSTLVWLFGEVYRYNKSKQRVHLDRVWEKRLAYGFITAERLEYERAVHGVCLQDADWLEVEKILQDFRQSA